ncbi:Gamma-glutamyltransferase ustH [Ceratocystis fimbriata CBS 114723]|uniref:Glutathione hydrolase n=1 Tax=Ceratocystis fimbriata CBS 114723 TaxID=1035309 RepID=A0A2C5X3V2_9PEZI|nr:Gamma-glutamyltransferase ustH [Ceratocystis fimbriata CBS 114723]
MKLTNSLLLAVGLASVAAFQTQIVVDNKANRGKTGAVASESIECSEIGRSILKRGGTAVDSLIGTVLCVGVVGMYHSGIGGGGFLLVRDSRGKYEAIDFRETAPAGASEDMYRDNIVDSIIGGLSVGVPGEIRGLQYAHKKYGVLPWKDLVMPAVKVARDGFRVTSDTIKYIDKALAEAPYNFLVENPVWAEDFAPNGTLLGRGDIMTRKRYADTLEKIATQGPDAFYTGEIAESLVNTVNSSNGILTLQDLEDYKVETREPLSVQYRNYTLHSIGAPASGAICLGNLKVMEQYDSLDWKNTNLSVHRLDEAMRFAYGARMKLGDPAFVKGVSSLEASLLQDSTAKDIRNKIDDDYTQPVERYIPQGIFATEGQGTSHIVTADKSGMATSLTTTINLLFGAQLMDPLTGIILNDEMNDFSVPGHHNEFGFAPSPSNFIRPGKRPLSSVSPVIIDTPSGSLYLTIGAAGGSRIISSTTQTIWHVIEHGMILDEALARPRQHDQLIPNQVTFEYSFDNATVDAMKNRGHHVTWVMEGLSAVQAIRVGEDGVFEPASEPRQKNSAGVSL